MNEFHLTISGEPVQVRVRHHPRAKRLRLRLRDSGVVEITVPRGCSRRQAEAFLLDSRDWIARNRVCCPAIIAPESIELPAIGRSWAVKYSGASSRLSESEGVIRLPETDWRSSLRRWLQRTGGTFLSPWLRRVSEELGLPCSRIVIRGQRTRWGSCSAAGNINLNYRLLFLPPELVRYLFVHELCHTVHLNHSAAFWSLVADKEPGFRKLDQRLRRAGVLVPRWAAAE